MCMANRQIVRSSHASMQTVSANKWAVSGRQAFMENRVWKLVRQGRQEHKHVGQGKKVDRGRQAIVEGWQAGREGKAKQEPGRQDKGIRQAMSGMQGRQTDKKC